MAPLYGSDYPGMGKQNAPSAGRADIERDAQNAGRNAPSGNRANERAGTQAQAKPSGQQQQQQKSGVQSKQAHVGSAAGCSSKPSGCN